MGNALFATKSLDVLMREAGDTSEHSLKRALGILPDDLPLLQRAVSSMTAGVLGLLILWGVCGLMIWGLLRGVRRLEHRSREGERSAACH